MGIFAPSTLENIMSSKNLSLAYNLSRKSRLKERRAEAGPETREANKDNHISEESDRGSKVEQEIVSDAMAQDAQERKESLLYHGGLVEDPTIESEPITAMEKGDLQVKDNEDDFFSEGGAVERIMARRMDDPGRSYSESLDSEKPEMKSEDITDLAQEDMDEPESEDTIDRIMSRRRKGK